MTNCQRNYLARVNYSPLITLPSLKFVFTSILLNKCISSVQKKAIRIDTGKCARDSHILRDQIAAYVRVNKYYITYIYSHVNVKPFPKCWLRTLLILCCSLYGLSLCTKLESDLEDLDGCRFIVLVVFTRV